MSATQAPDEGGAQRDPLVIVEMTEHHVLATWRNVGIVLWIDETTADAVARAQAMLALLAKEQPDGTAFLQVVCEGCQRLDTEARAAIQSLLKSGRPHIRDAPVVFEGDGFRAAAVRAIVAGIAALSGRGLPRVCPTVTIAADTLARKLDLGDVAAFAGDLTRAVAQARIQHRAKFPPAASIRPRTSWRPKPRKS